MNKKLYTAEESHALGKIIRRGILGMIGLVVLSIGVGVICLVFANLENKNWMILLNVILSSLCGCFALYLLFETVLPAHYKREYNDEMRNSKGRIVRGLVIKDGKCKTLNRYITFKELWIRDVSGEEKVLYWDISFDDASLLGHVVQFRVVNGKIVEVEEAS